MRRLPPTGILLIAGSTLVLALAAAPIAPERGMAVDDRALQQSFVGPSDTLRAGVTAGEPLVLALPDTVAGRPVAAYTTVRAPTLSRRVDRAFFWQTRPQEAGRYRLLFAATFAGAPADTLVVFVTVGADGRP